MAIKVDASIPPMTVGYQRRSRSSRSCQGLAGPVCSKRWATRSVHCICCFLTNPADHLVDRHSTNAVLIVSPCRRRSPKFGMNSRFLLRRGKLGAGGGAVVV